MPSELDGPQENLHRPNSAALIRIMWLLTTAAALLLALATVDLVNKISNYRSKAEPAAVLTGGSHIVLLRAAPDASSAVVSVLERGERVEILANTVIRGKTWIRVKSEMGSGWIPSEQILFQFREK